MIFRPLNIKAFNILVNSPIVYQIGNIQMLPLSFVALQFQTVIWIVTWIFCKIVMRSLEYDFSFSRWNKNRLKMQVQVIVFGKIYFVLEKTYL